ncbi:MAG: L-2-hydroxyglutarate oxidase [Acidobacteria bacterium]|nr:L-2-hydroxyglutarate oxidase [Acidobacteriota bacterium]
MTRAHDFVIIGGGIVGLATAYELTRRFSDASIAVIEKEREWAAHQSGRNSGVIHSGIYYQPGSLKSALCASGRGLLIDFCREESIPYEICGKIIAAVDGSELPQLHSLAERGRKNGLDVRLLQQGEARELEPHLECIEAVHVPEAGIVDYRAVSERLAERLRDHGVTLMLGSRVESIVREQSGRILHTTTGEVRGRKLISCAGLHSDRLALLDDIDPEMRIIPFRGEYHELREERKHLVRNMIYPVPDARFPFLGVHLTRGIDGSVHAGPNAVLAFSREGYGWRTVSWRDLKEIISYGPFLKFAMGNWRFGFAEMSRSLSSARFVKALQELIPAIQREDIVRSAAGVRAQALESPGKLVDDFRIRRDGDAIHVLNAPSPAATSSFAIARHLVNEIR